MSNSDVRYLGSIILLFLKNDSRYKHFEVCFIHQLYTKLVLCKSVIIYAFWYTFAFEGYGVGLVIQK